MVNATDNFDTICNDIADRVMDRVNIDAGDFTGIKSANELRMAIYDEFESDIEDELDYVSSEMATYVLDCIIEKLGL